MVLQHQATIDTQNCRQVLPGPTPSSQTIKDDDSMDDDERLQHKTSESFPTRFRRLQHFSRRHSLRISDCKFKETYVRIIAINNNKTGLATRDLLLSKPETRCLQLIPISSRLNPVLCKKIAEKWKNKKRAEQKSHKSINKITLGTIREH